MDIEHETLKQRFKNGEAMTRSQVLKLCRYEGNNWPLELWEEEQILAKEVKTA